MPIKESENQDLCCGWDRREGEQRHCSSSTSLGPWVNTLRQLAALLVSTSIQLGSWSQECLSVVSACSFSLLVSILSVVCQKGVWCQDRLEQRKGKEGILRVEPWNPAPFSSFLKLETRVGSGQWRLWGTCYGKTVNQSIHRFSISRAVVSLLLAYFKS